MSLLAFAPRLLGQLPLSLSVGRNIDEDFPEADNGAGFVSYRAGRAVDPNLSLDAVFIDKKALLGKDNAFSGHDAVKDWFPGGPSRGQRIEDRPTESSRMKGAENVGIGVIIEKDRFRSPLHGSRKAAREHHLDRRFQALRPR